MLTVWRGKVMDSAGIVGQATFVKSLFDSAA
jgi:hypothetical protein